MKNQAHIAALLPLLVACGPVAPTRFEVPERCYAEGTTIEITSLDALDVLELHYGAQGGQHVYLPLVLRGVDPRAASVHVELTRPFDGQVIADQVLTHFEPGEDECDVVVSRTELFVLSARSDGLEAVVHVAVGDAERTFDPVCIASGGGGCDAPTLALVAGGARVEPGARVFLDDAGMLTLSVDRDAHGAGDLWGRIGETRIESTPGEPLAIAARDGGALEVRLVLQRWAGPFEGGVLARFEGALQVGCDVLGDATQCGDGVCDRGLDEGAPSRCRARGEADVGDACGVPEDCGAGATCAERTCRAWCEPSVLCD